MIKRLALSCVSLLLPQIAAAGTIVTWQSVGVIESSSFGGFQDTGRVPPPGTPYQLTMMFDPSAMTPTALSPPGSNCFSVSVSSSLTVGGLTYGGGGSGFTHAQLPGTNCTPRWPETQFLLAFPHAPSNSPWPIQFGFMELWYRDLLVQDAFPNAPTHNGGRFQIRDQSGSYLIMARHNLQAVDPQQPAPVPEPGTLTLFGLGLAVVARKMRHISLSK